MRSRYKITQNDGLHFITSTTIEWIPVFTSDNQFKIFIDSVKFCQKHKNLKVYAYVILENHFHMIVSGNNLSNTIQSLKRYTTQQIIKLSEKQSKKWLLNQLSFYKKRHKIQSKNQLWQEGFHPELIFNDRMLIQKIEYIHYNPVKRGVVDRPEYWKYSSARNFILDDHSVITLDMLPILLI
jgi:REP element-mobilizing transposase RayT